MNTEDIKQGMFVTLQDAVFVVVHIFPDKTVALSPIINGICVDPSELEEYFFDHETKIERI